MTMTMTTTPPTIDAAVVDSLITRGDISALSKEDRAKYYLAMCESLGLTASSQPFAVLKLNGKEILYPTRGATDQLAAIHRLNREIVDGPKEITVSGVKMIYAMCRATHPNGRVETAVATVPATDLLNALMKCETKAKRRATLSILGLGMLDEMEVEAIPVTVKQPAEQIAVTVIEESKDTLEDWAKSVNKARSMDELRDVRAEMPEAFRHPLRPQIFKALCRLATTIDELEKHRPWLDKIETPELVAECTAAYNARAAELSGPDPKDDGPKTSKRKPSVRSSDATAGANEATPDLNHGPTALAALNRCGTPQHALSHYAKHHAHKALNERQMIRNALVSMLANRWPNYAGDRDAAEKMVASREAECTARVAA